MIDVPYFLIMFVTAGLGLLTVVGLMKAILGVTVDHPKALQIASAIRTGAMTFLKEEYRIIACAIIPLAFLLAYLFETPLAGITFICGAFGSMMTGFIGMWAATAANVRTATQARAKGEHAAFMTSFFGGGVMGFAVASIGLLGMSTLFYLFYEEINFFVLITTFGAGASLVAFFARIGGGIYTKAADVGADLVGKVEIGIPEDDPRNPATIADNVGDCVGDTAGMGADIYESYVGALISAIILMMSLTDGSLAIITLPLMLAAFGLVSSLVGLCANLVIKASQAACSAMQPILRSQHSLPLRMVILLTLKFRSNISMQLFLAAYQA